MTATEAEIFREIRMRQLKHIQNRLLQEPDWDACEIDGIRKIVRSIRRDLLALEAK